MENYNGYLICSDLDETLTHRGRLIEKNTASIKNILKTADSLRCRPEERHTSLRPMAGKISVLTHISSVLTERSSVTPTART